MRNKNAKWKWPFFEGARQLGTNKNYKLKPKSKTTQVKKIKEVLSIQQVATKWHARKISLSDQFLNEVQTELLKLVLAFTPTTKFDLNTMENYLFAFICKLCLIYHCTDINENEINTDQSLLKRLRHHNSLKRKNLKI